MVDDLVTDAVLPLLNGVLQRNELQSALANLGIHGQRHTNAGITCQTGESKAQNVVENQKRNQKGRHET